MEQNWYLTIGEANITGGTFNMSNSSIGQNSGKFNIKNVTIECSSGLENRYGGDVYIENATIKLNSSAMSNESNSKLTIVNSNITNTSSNNVVIYLQDTATAEIKSGTFTSAANVINNASSTSTVILGEKDGNVKENLTLTTESNYTTVWNNGSLYYYDGKIKGKTALMGGVSEIEENTYIDISIEDGFEIASLKPIEYVAEVTNAEYTNERCKTLKEAITKCGNTPNSIVKVVSDFTVDESSKGIIQDTQDITIDLHGHTITGFAKESIITNNGILKITDLSDGEAGKAISRGNTLIENIGSLEIENVTMQINKSGSNYNNLNYVISNSGTFTMNSGTLTMASISNARVLNNKASGTIEINGGNIIAKNGVYAIYSNSTGTITLNTSNISSSKTYVVYNDGTGKIIIDGAAITGTDSDSGNWYSCYGLYNNSGSIELKSGTILAKGYYGLYNKSGTLTMSGGSIEGEYTGINNESGNITVTGGTVKTKYLYYDSYAAILNNTGTITLGKKDGEVSTSSPNIIGAYSGVYNIGGIFNFYDGIIEAKQSYSITGNKSDMEEDYNIITYKNGESEDFPVDSGREKTILKQVEVAKIGNNTYSSIIKAFEEAVSGDTIEMLRDTSISSNQSTIEIEENKNIILDLAGYTISSVKSTSIINSGNLEIIDSSQSSSGKFINTSGNFCENLAGATLSLTSGTVQTNSSETIKNKGEIILQGANIVMNSSDYCAIKNEIAGNITVISGKISSSGNIINSNSEGSIEIQGGTLETSGYSKIILNLSNSEIVRITGGSLRKTSYSATAIYNYNANNTEIYISGAQTVIDGNINLYNNAYLQIDDGTIMESININNTSTVLINDGNLYFLRAYSTGDITINGGSFSYGVDNCELNNITINDGTMSNLSNSKGTITINGGTIESTSNNAIENKENGTIIIKNCEVKSNAIGINNSGNSTIILGENNELEGPTITSSGNYGVSNSGIFKYYNGTIVGKNEAIIGKVNDIPANKVIVLNKQSNIETATLESNVKIAKIGNIEYTSLNIAIEDFDSSTDEEITIISDFVITEKDKVEIESNKDVIINLNGKTITTMAAVNAITNNGILKIIDDNTNGTIISRSETIINNLGTLEIDGGTYRSSTNTNYLIINKGNFTLTSGNIAPDCYAVQNDSLGNIWLNGGNITLNSSTKGGYAIYNSSGKVFINNNVIIDADGYWSMTAIKNQQAGEVEINGGTIESGDTITNEGKMTINGGTIEIKTSSRSISNKSYGTITITAGTINSEGYGIENSSRNLVKIEGGEITAKQEVITNDNYRTNSTIIEISGGTLTSINSSAVKNINRYGNERLTVTGGTIISEKGIGIENSGILTLGKDEGDYPSTTVPEINGKAYGVKSSATFNFYDGIVKGETKAIDGTVTDKPYGYKVVTNEENTEAYLAISPEVDKPVILNGNNMDSLEIAMLALSNFDNKVGTIVFRKDVTLAETLVVPSDVTVTFVLQGHAITYDGENEAIENNGTLTIVDYEDPSEALDPGIASVVRNIGTGVAIENNGSLTLGASGGQVNANSPVISGGVTGNAPVIYDGKVEN